MFLGHYALAMGAKRVVPKVSLGTLVLAAQLADLLWPILLLAGIERVRISPGITSFSPLNFEYYPITHSLLGITVLGIVLAVIYFGVTRSRAGAWVVGVLAVSHWVLDVIVHRPDLPLALGSETRMGFGLWNSIPATIALELALYAAGVYVYLRSTAARDGIGRNGFWTLALLLLFIFLGNAFGPPPPNEQVLALFGLAGWLVVLWAYWVDAHRMPRA